MRKLCKPPKRTGRNQRRNSLLSLSLAVSMTLPSVAPLLIPQAAAADDAYAFAQPAIAKLSEWNVMWGDNSGNLNLGSYITRAEFAALVNRSYGYTKVSAKTPFSDIPENAWYADDIAIAYQAGYLNGTSESTASPEEPLTREQAIMILAKNARLQEIPGEVNEFTDGRSFSSWSAGYVKAAVKHGIADGYPDGTYRPKQPATRAEMACLLCNTLGTLVSSAGTHSLADVAGNVTVNAPGVSLKDTTIMGDLYLTSGLGLGAITLDNMKVFGNIIIAGSGESEAGEDSIILRNVEADTLIVDSPDGQYLSLRAEGATKIEQNFFRSGAFIRDQTGDGYGLTNITLDSTEKNTKYSLAGTLQNITNKAPASVMTVGDGTIQTLTIDEEGAGSELNLDVNMTVKTLNLDTGVAVTGLGDIESIVINTEGSSTAMLPDKITIRPGINATIAGTSMDMTAAQASSSEPRLLAGYPKASDVAPKNVKVKVSTNKTGTVYWGVSTVTQGSLTESELITPASYSTKALKTGNTKISKENKEHTISVAGLTPGIAYYFAAVLVDAQGKHSQVKVISFTTPDDSVPAFASGYPKMSLVTNKDAQASAMATKSCNLYYALLPKGSAAPLTSDFLAGTISGNIGMGVVQLTKNMSSLFFVNNTELSEKVEYDLYLWLCDADGGKNSAIKKLTFSTVDKTPPVFTKALTITKIEKNSLGGICALNEDGTVYWAVVESGEPYPRPATGEVDPPPLTDELAMLQVVAGTGALKSGNVRVKANTDATVNISGLQPETAYDIYYVAKDNAGNYSVTIQKITENTLDTVAPTATQKFTKYFGSNVNTPLADTDVQIIFSENVIYAETGKQLLELYTNKNNDMDAFTNALRNTIRLYNATGTGIPQRVSERQVDDPTNTDWTIDYRYATVKLDGKNLVVTFPTVADSNRSGLNLRSGSTYYFEIENIADTSSARNLMGLTQLERFTTIPAQVALEGMNLTQINVGGKDLDVDMAFSITPQSTSKVDKDLDWDMIFWMDTSCHFELYRLGPQDGAQWEKVGGTEPILFATEETSPYLGVSLWRDFENKRENPPLQTLPDNQVYQYAIHFSEVEGIKDRTAMSQLITSRISIVSGTSVNLGNLAADLTQQNFEDSLKRGVADIGTPEDFLLRKQFKDTSAPSFTDGHPHFEYHDTNMTMDLLLNRPGTVYYAVAPVGTIVTRRKMGPNDTVGSTFNFEQAPISGDPAENPWLSANELPFILANPNYSNIVRPTYTNEQIKTGSVEMTTGISTIEVEDLKPSTDYYVYLVTKGNGQVFSETMLYRFTTTEITRPVIELSRSNPIVTIKSDLTAKVDYALIPYNSQMDELLQKPFRDAVSEADQAALYKAFGEKDAEAYLNDKVLEAMATNVQSGINSAGSLFDLYATTAYKDKVAEFIRSASPTTGGAIIGTGSTNVTGGRTQKVDCSKFEMSPQTQYSLVAVGRSTLGSGDAFRATHPVMLVDNQPPKVIVIADSALYYDEDTKTLNGRFTLTFDETLYYLDRKNDWNMYKIDNAPMEPDRTASGFVSVEETVDPASRPDGDGKIRLSTDPQWAKQPTQSITIYCDGSKPGEYIQFNNITDYNTAKVTAPLTVIIDVEKEKIKNDDGTVDYEYTPVVKITPSIWDGRDKKK